MNNDILIDNDILTLLRKEIAGAAAQMKKCEGAYKGFRAFRHSPQGLAFCAAQLHQAAGALREAAERLVAIAETIHANASDMPQQLELDDITLDGRA
jgi:hypothetical protein